MTAAVRRTAPSCPRWPRTLAALEVRNYRLYLSSQIVATTGLWMQRIAQDWLVLELTGSITAVGVAVALQFLPVLLFGLFGGVIADRYPKRRILMITQSVAATMALTLGLLALTHTVQAWHVFVVAAMLGLRHRGGQPDPAGVRLRAGRHPAHPERGQPELLGLPVRCAARSRPCPGLLIHAVGQGWSFMINFAACLLVVAIVGIIRVPARTADRRRFAPRVSCARG